MKKIILSSFLAVSLVSAAGFTDAGTMEAGGRLSLHSYANNNASDTRGSQVIIEPLFNIYIVDQLYGSAKLHFQSQNGFGFFGIGGGIGYAFMPDSPIVPYVEGGIEFIHSGWLSKAGMALPISGGIKIPVYSHAIIDLNASFYTKFINDNPGSDFGLAGGVTIPIF